MTSFRYEWSKIMRKFVNPMLILSIVVCFGIFLGCAQAVGGDMEKIKFTIGYENMKADYYQIREDIINTFAEWISLRGDSAELTVLDAKYDDIWNYYY